MKKLLLLIPFLFSPLFAQTVVIQRPDCQLTLGLITAAPTNVGPFDNRTAGCTFWAIIYNSNGFSALSLLVQTAPDAGGTPGSWSTYTAASGVNPNTTTTQNSSTFGTSYFPWLRVQLTSKTGTGSISGNLYGWRYPPPATITAIIGLVTVVGNKSNNAVVPGSTNLGVLPCIANAAAPTWTETFQVGCSVDLAGNQRVVAVGPVAVGAAAAGNPLRNGGANAAGNVVGEKFGNNGGVIAEGVTLAQADGQSNSILVTRILNEAGGALNVGFDRNFPFIFNGSTWDREFVCTNRALVTLTDATLTALVAVSGATIVRVCQVHASTSGGAETISLLQGTGAACAGSPVTIDSYVGTLAFSTDYGNTGALRTSASNGLCVQQSGAAQTAVVVVTYAQY